MGKLCHNPASIVRNHFALLLTICLLTISNRIKRSYSSLEAKNEISADQLVYSTQTSITAIPLNSLATGNRTAQSQQQIYTTKSYEIEQFSISFVDNIVLYGVDKIIAAPIRSGENYMRLSSARSLDIRFSKHFAVDWLDHNVYAFDRAAAASDGAGKLRMYSLDNTKVGRTIHNGTQTIRDIVVEHRKHFIAWLADNTNIIRAAKDGSEQRIIYTANEGQRIHCMTIEPQNERFLFYVSTKNSKSTNTKSNLRKRRQRRWQQQNWFQQEHEQTAKKKVKAKKSAKKEPEIEPDFDTIDPYDAKLDDENFGFEDILKQIKPSAAPSLDDRDELFANFRDSQPTFIENTPPLDDRDELFANFRHSQPPFIENTLPRGEVAPTFGNTEQNGNDDDDEAEDRDLSLYSIDYGGKNSPIRESSLREDPRMRKSTPTYIAKYAKSPLFAIIKNVFDRTYSLIEVTPGGDDDDESPVTLTSNRNRITSLQIVRPIAKSFTGAQLCDKSAYCSSICVHRSDDQAMCVCGDGSACDKYVITTPIPETTSGDPNQQSSQQQLDNENSKSSIWKVITYGIVILLLGIVGWTIYTRYFRTASSADPRLDGSDDSSEKSKSKLSQNGKKETSKKSFFSLSSIPGGGETIQKVKNFFNKIVSSSHETETDSTISTSLKGKNESKDNSNKTSGNRSGSIKSVKSKSITEKSAQRFSSAHKSRSHKAKTSKHRSISKTKSSNMSTKSLTSKRKKTKQGQVSQKIGPNKQKRKNLSQKRFVVK